ncbi:hypothetical protein [Brevundimonas bacteroides]|uniref:hypothetical protein n=1 Tax=Brevundimonas bacteroides TaxID=74311 RepID=UPI0004982D6A|nr:hypothetical protein [Brevundimonas bacteroides]
MTKLSVRVVMAGAAAALMLAACSQTGGEAKADGEAASQAAPASAGAVTFEARPDIREGVQALPRVVGDTPAIVAINADIDRINADTAGCDGPGTFTRFASMPMTGPGFLTLAVADDWSCEGAAHPSVTYAAVTWDLSTGRRVDWVTAAPGLSATRPEDDGFPATYEPGLQSAPLAEWYGRKMMASTDAEWLGECRDLFTNGTLAERYYKLWLDAQTGGIAVMVDFPHVAQYCAETATMNEAEMSQFGVSPAMIDAVLAATAAENFGPKG